MSSFSQPPVMDADVMAQISDARSANGVHIYFDEPISKNAFLLKTPVSDLDATRTRHLNWSTVARATADKPNISTVLCNDAQDYCIESGVSGRPFQPYMAKNDAGSWTKPQEAELPDKYQGKKHDYIVLTLRILYPFKDASGNAAINNQVSCEFNGKSFPTTLKFKKQDLKHLARNVYTHRTLFANVEVIEYHFEYTGVTAGIEAGSPLRSLKFANLTHLSAGGYAVITGKYEQHNNTFSGIVIGVGKMDGSSEVTGTKHFSNLSDSSKEHTFKVTLSDVSTTITVGREKADIANVLAGDSFVWLLVQNINIENLEIHSGRRPHT
ncbi:uncharacterized protein LOC144110450 [Amblyomma americanum]